MKKKEITAKLLEKLHLLTSQIEDLHDFIEVANKSCEFDNEDEEMDLDELFCNVIDQLVVAQESVETCYYMVEDGE